MLSTLIIGNRKTDPLLEIVDDSLAVSRYTLLDDMTFKEKCKHPDDFETDRRPLRFLELHGLLHHSSKQRYRITNGYRHAKSLLEQELFDTIFVYKLFDINQGEFDKKSFKEIEKELSSRPNASNIITNAQGLVVILANDKIASSLDVYRQEMLEEMKSKRQNNLIVSYARGFEDVIALNEDIAKDPARYIDRGTLVLYGREGFLNK
jgi:hypothetical protein